jgi:hypothetical protein
VSLCAKPVSLCMAVAAAALVICACVCAVRLCVCVTCGGIKRNHQHFSHGRGRRFAVLPVLEDLRRCA